MGMNKEKIYKWIDLTVFPKHKHGAIDWSSSVGCTTSFVYGERKGTLTILNKLSSSKYRILINVDDEQIEYDMNSSDIKKCSIGGAFFKPLAITHPDLIKYFVDKAETYKYSAYSNAETDMICPLCGTNRKKIIYVLTEYGLGCPACSDGISYPNKLMYSVLKQTGIEFINELTKKYNGFEWIADYRYDFYFVINNNKYIVEMDGKLHDGSRRFSKEEARQIDLIKDNLARSHDIHVIRIDCRYDHVQDRFNIIQNNILNSELKNLLCFSDVNWDEANMWATNSNIKLAADKWNNSDLCAIDIGTELGVSRDTARGYLKIAAKLGLCNYNDEEVDRRMRIRITKNNKKKQTPCVLLKNDIIIGVFAGVVLLDKLSTDLYGRHIDYRNAYEVMKGHKKQTCGYVLKELTKEQYEQYKLEQIVPVY